MAETETENVTGNKSCKYSREVTASPKENTERGQWTVTYMYDDCPNKLKLLTATLEYIHVSYFHTRESDIRQI